MSLRSAGLFLALMAVFTAVGGGIALAGAAAWKGTSPGESKDSRRDVSVGEPVPRALQNRAAGTLTPSTAPAPATTPRATAPQAASPRAATPSPSGFPVVLDLVVCDATVDCGEDPAKREWDVILTCLRVRPGAESRPLVLVITAGQASPGGPENPSVIARSGAIRAGESLACHNVRAVGRPLARGEYTMWVFDGSVALRQARFRLGR